MKAYKLKYLIGLLILTFSISLLNSCKPDEPIPIETWSSTPYNLEIPFRFPTMTYIPADNPMTVEGIALGRMLFYDGRLSGRTHPDSLMSCGTCHLQEYGFECGVNHPDFINGQPHGLTGISTPHTMMPLVNMVWTPNNWLWNGSVDQMEIFTYKAIIAPHEINGDTAMTVALLSSIEMYPPMFKAAFGTEDITIDRMGKAIAQFIRTLISSNSRFDQYISGSVQFTQQELAGLVLFTTEEGADCFHCHGGSANVLLTTFDYYNNGKDSLFTGPYEDTRDRFHVSGDPMDLGAYKAPTLRNITVTAPYMHDGRFLTLDEVLNFYDQELVNSPYIDPLMHKIDDNGMKLNPIEMSQLKAFLNTLTDTSFLTNPAFGPPDELPMQWRTN